MIKLLLSIAFSFAISFSFSQENIRVMVYNLLNFMNYTSYCTSENNPHEAKAQYLATIINNQQPDIFAVCELGTSPSASYTTNFILGNALNINGQTKWQAASPTGSYLINGLYFDKTKFQLHSQPVVSTSVRDINIYRLKYLNSEEDVFFNVIVAHLKAGSSSADAAQRSDMIQNVMDQLQQYGSNENYIIVGDFNVYTHTEPAFQKLVNPSNPNLAFFDPIDKIGAWNSNYTYRFYHTQSTRDDFNNDCFSGGGMDDRFDWIMISSSIKDGSAAIKYKEDSYWAVGQDGLRYNGDFMSPTNSTLPSNVITALYNMSDHLPVVADFEFGEHNSSISFSTDPDFYANVISPTSNSLTYSIKTNKQVPIKVYLYSLSGLKLMENSIIASSEDVFSNDISDLSDGLYLLVFEGNGIRQTVRLIKTSLY